MVLPLAEDLPEAVDADSQALQQILLDVPEGYHSIE
jgi:hypothetical protein